MRIFSRFVAWIYSLVALGISLLLISISVRWLSLNQFFFYLQKIGNLRLGIAGGSFLLLGIIWLIFITINLSSRRTISFSNPGGEVKVSISAIEDFITRKVLGEVKAVKSIRCEAIPEGKGIRVTNRVVLWSEYDIPTVSSNIQDLIKRYLQDTIGVEKVGLVKVYVSRISTSPVEEIEEEKEEVSE